MAGQRRRASYDALAFDPDDAVVRLRMHVRILAALQVLQGSGYLFGAPATAPSLQLLADGFPLVGMLGWAALLVCGGTLMLTGRLALGNAVCALVCVVWAFFAFIVLPLGVATGWAWPWPLGLAVAHGYALYRSARAWARARQHTRTPARG